MAKSEVDKVTEEKIAHGGVLVNVYFDMQHKEREKLQQLMVDLVNERLLKERGVVYCYGAIEEPLEKEGIFTTSAKITTLVDNFMALVNIAFNYSPAGIEILKPNSEMRFKVSELQSMLMDLSQISANYSRFILEKVLKKEDIEEINAALENRAAIGKKLMETSNKQPEGNEQ